MNTSKKALLIFIKNPEKGKVKTRLASTLGDEKAFAVYQKLLHYTRSVALQTNATRQLWYSRFVDKKDDWDTEHFQKEIQNGASLGDRMKYAFIQAFSQNYDKAIIIGSDCAQLEESHVEEAFQALDDHEVVIGPSQDGGYYLLGMSKLLPDLFENIAWSTPEVFGQTIASCKQNGWRYHTLETLNDVDTEDDWNQVKDQF